MSNSFTESSQNIPQTKLSYAGFWSRCIAALVDVIIVTIISLLIIVLTEFLLNAKIYQLGNVTGSALFIRDFLIFSPERFLIYEALHEKIGIHGFNIQVLYVLYDILMIYKFQTTIGGFICKIKVINRASLALAYSSILVIIFNLCYLVFSKKKRNFQDRICDTYVVSRTSNLSTIQNERNRIYASSLYQIGQITYVGFWRRAAAMIVEIIFLGLLHTITSLLLLFDTDYYFLYRLLILVFIFYRWLSIYKYQGTLGCYVVRIRVISNKYQACSLRQAFMHCFVPLDALLWVINIFVLIFSNKKRDFQNRIADTYVVHYKSLRLKTEHLVYDEKYS